MALALGLAAAMAEVTDQGGKEPATLLRPYPLLTTSCPGGTHTLGLWMEGQMDRGSQPLAPRPHLL